MMILIPKSVSLSLVTHRLQRDGIIGEKDCNEISNPDNECKESDNNNIGDVKFRFPTFEEFCRIRTGNSNSKYEFATSGKSSVRGFIEEPKSFPVDEISNADESDEVRRRRTGQGISGSDGNGHRKADQTMEEFPGNDEFLDESLFSCSDNTNSNDSFLSDQDFQGKLDDAECDGNPIPGLNSSSGMEENQGMFFPDDGGGVINTDFLSEKDFESQLVSDNNNNTANKLETLWEHQELIEQLKMELRKVRATGLPTIVEESESPRITTDDIKPWKIDESLQHEDCIDEVNKLYKSYSETMRKFDILNYQKMYAMGFVQLKDPFKPTPQQRSAPSTLKLLISQNLGLFRHRRNEREDNNPVKKLVSDLRGDLEVVYVGQVCLSWEFLHWQYARALDLWNSDPQGIHHYNEVAAEFQQFQVLIQRFVEDEAFRGPRVQSYVKMRCVVRNLLQVPAIREDDEKDKKKKNKARRRSNRDDEYIITGEMLVKIIEESIRILWQFIRSDKDCSAQPSNIIPHLHNPHDLKFLSQIKKTLQKKERKLKDIMRSEKCILRRFQQTTKEKAANDRVSDQALFFFAQVDMKLVSRVLNMSKITRDQLLWCQNKLSRISFLNRRIHVNPAAAAAFLQFPCNTN